MTFRTPEQDQITRSGLAAARAVLAAARRPAQPTDQPNQEDPERRNQP